MALEVRFCCLAILLFSDLLIVLACVASKPLYPLCVFLFVNVWVVGARWGGPRWAPAMPLTACPGLIRLRFVEYPIFIIFIPNPFCCCSILFLSVCWCLILSSVFLVYCKGITSRCVCCGICPVSDLLVGNCVVVLCACVVWCAVGVCAFSVLLFFSSSFRGHVWVSALSTVSPPSLPLAILRSAEVGQGLSKECIAGSPARTPRIPASVGTPSRAVPLAKLF